MEHSKITVKTFNEIDENWTWHTSVANDGGRKIRPRDMKTTHLFYTFRMIWNNTAPPHARVGHVKLYNFGEKYTVDYFTQAVRFMGYELTQRDDLPEWMRAQLDQMARHFWARLNKAAEAAQLENAGAK